MKDFDLKKVNGYLKTIKVPFAFKIDDANPSKIDNDDMIILEIISKTLLDKEIDFDNEKIDEFILSNILGLYFCLNRNEDNQRVIKSESIGAVSITYGDNKIVQQNCYKFSIYLEKVLPEYFIEDDNLLSVYKNNCGCDHDY